MGILLQFLLDLQRSCLKLPNRVVLGLGNREFCCVLTRLPKPCQPRIVSPVFTARLGFPNFADSWYRPRNLEVGLGGSWVVVVVIRTFDCRN